MRVGEYLAYRAKLKGVERAGRTARIDYCLDKCRIKEVQNRLLGTLSKGYRQRVGLADALLADPPILILDEPTSGLDPVQINETLDTIRELGGKHTVLLSTHILPEVEKVCERVIIIDKGRIKLDETMKAIESREPSYADRSPRPGRRGPEVPPRAARSDVGGSQAPRRRPDRVRGARPRTARTRASRWPRRSIAKGWAVRRLELRKVNLDALFNEVVRSRYATTPPRPGTAACRRTEPTKTPAA